MPFDLPETRSIQKAHHFNYNLLQIKSLQDFTKDIFYKNFWYAICSSPFIFN